MGKSGSFCSVHPLYPMRVRVVQVLGLLLAAEELELATPQLLLPSSASHSSSLFRQSDEGTRGLCLSCVWVPGV